MTSVANYDVATDLELIDGSSRCATRTGWRRPAILPDRSHRQDPIFIVGLPRTGTTLTERILASHSQVESVGETQFLQMMLRSVSGVETVESMNPAMMRRPPRRTSG